MVGTVNLFATEEVSMFTRRFYRTSFASLALGSALVAGLVMLPSASVVASTGPTSVFHLKLVRAEPAVDSTFVSSPESVKLWFSEAVHLKSTSVKVTDKAGAAVELGALSRDSAADAPVVAKVMKTMAPGRYTVTWRSMGKDSHVVKGHFFFVVATEKPADKPATKPAASKAKPKAGQ